MSISPPPAAHSRNPIIAFFLVGCVVWCGDVARAQSVGGQQSYGATSQMPAAGVGPAATQAASGPTMGQMASKLNPANWSMPKMKMPSFSALLPGQSDKERIVKKKNSLVTDVTETTKRTWARTKQALNPSKLNPMNLFAGGGAGSPQPASAKSESNSPSLFGSLFARPQPQEEKVATVNDFLKQERPR